MTITFENESYISVYSFEKIVSFCRDHHYLCAAKSVRWISSLIELQPTLVYYIDNQRFLREIRSKEVIGGSTTNSTWQDPDQSRPELGEVSTVPRDIPKQSFIASIGHQAIPTNYLSDPLRRTQKGESICYLKAKDNFRRKRKD